MTQKTKPAGGGLSHSRTTDSLSWTGPITLTAGEVERYIRACLPNLKKSGGEYRGPCPIHDGERDSFVINAETGRWFCHSECDRGGDIIGLHMEIS